MLQIHIRQNLNLKCDMVLSQLLRDNILESDDCDSSCSLDLQPIRDQQYPKIKIDCWCAATRQMTSQITLKWSMSKMLTPHHDLIYSPKFLKSSDFHTQKIRFRMDPDAVLRCKNDTRWRILHLKTAK